MPLPDFLRPLVPDPVCKSKDPRPPPLPGSTEQTCSVPFSQGPEGSSPCWQGVTPPFFPPPPSSPPPMSLPRTPPLKPGLASPYLTRNGVPLGATTQPPPLYQVPTHQYLFSVAPLTEVIVGATRVGLVGTFPQRLAILGHDDPV